MIIVATNCDAQYYHDNLKKIINFKKLINIKNVRIVNIYTQMCLENIKKFIYKGKKDKDREIVITLPHNLQ